MIHQKVKWDFSSQSSVLLSIEYLVDNIARRYAHEMALPARARDHLSQADFYASRVLAILPEALKQLRPGYLYSEAVEAFWSACRTVGFVDGYSPTRLVYGHPYEVGEARYQTASDLVGLIPSLVASDDFKRREVVRRYEASQKAASVDQYVRSIFALRHKLHVVRVDGGFRQEFYPSVEVDILYTALKQFREQIKHGRGPFEHCLGYVIGAEQGRDREWHFHSLLFFDASRVASHWHQARLVGEAWVRCTDGFGTYFNVNALLPLYESLGINGLGLVFRSDLEKQELVLRAARYLSDPDKDDQFLRMRPEGTRTFWKGRAREHSGRGRPFGNGMPGH